MTDGMALIKAWVERQRRFDRRAPAVTAGVALATAFAWPVALDAGARVYWRGPAPGAGGGIAVIDGSQTPASCVAIGLAALLLTAAGFAARRVAGARAATSAWGTMALLAPGALLGCLGELRAIPTISYDAWAAYGQLHEAFGAFWHDLARTFLGAAAEGRGLAHVVAAVVLAFGAWAVGRAAPSARRTSAAVRGVAWAASAALLVAASWRLATRPHAADHVRSLPVVGSVPAADHPRARDVLAPRVMDCEGLRCRVGPRHYASCCETYLWERVQLDTTFGDVVLRRMCDHPGVRCGLYWTKAAGRAREGAWWFALHGLGSLDRADEVTVRRDDLHRVLVVGSRRETLGTIPLDADVPRGFSAGPDPHLLDRADALPLESMPITATPASFAPPWQYVALAAAGLAASLALARRRPAKVAVVRGVSASHDGRGALRLASGERVDEPSLAQSPAGPVVVVETAPPSPAGPYRGGDLRRFEALAVTARQVAAWDAARERDLALAPLAVLALTHAPLGAAAALGLVF